MKKIKYIILLLVGGLMASCMGADYAAPELNADHSPWGNNEIKETNVLTIAQLKSKFADVINQSSYTQITEPIQIKGIVTGNDEKGNIYQEISLQDNTGALLVCISGSGLYGYLPVGQEVLIDLDSLYIGGYGQQAEIGGVYTNTNSASSNYGTHSIGRMDRFVWDQHYKLIGTPDKSKADALKEVFDLSLAGDAHYLEQNAGKLMTIKRVAFKDANGRNVYAPSDGSVVLTANSANRAMVNLSTGTATSISTNTLVVRTSTYADFANTILPKDTLDITGIFTRYRNTWQILLRDAEIGEGKDLRKSLPPFYSNDFATNPFDLAVAPWTIDNGTLPEGVTKVWSFDSRNGLKATAYVAPNRYETHARAISPAIDLSKAESATLTFSHTAKYFGNAKDELQVQVSTDRQNWQTLDYTSYPSGKDWTFVTATADLTAYAGKTIYVCFYYNSSKTSAATWEIKSIKVD